MKPKSKAKKIWIIVLVIIVMIGAGFGGWYFLRNRSKEPVNVYPFSYIGMTEYWGDNQESYGPITTDKIQTVFVSETQTVTEILVADGDAVKKGDLLMTFDTTLSDLALERKRLDVEKLKLQLENAEKELREIRNMKPMVIPQPSPDPEPEENKGIMLTDAFQISQNKEFDGSSPEKSLILWLQDAANLETSVFEAVRVKAEEYQSANVPASTEPVTEATTPDSTVTEPTTESATEPDTEPVTEPAAPPVTETPVSGPVNHFYVIVKSTEGNMSLGAQTLWQGMEVSKTGNGTFAFRFFDAHAVADHTLAQQEQSESNSPQIDFGSGFTATQIAQMRTEKEKQIKDLKFQIKMAEADYAIKKTELETGEVIAKFDGTVVGILSEEEAKQTGQPLMKISGGGGFYMEGSVSELEKDNLQIGQEVTVNDWNTGMIYTGTVQSVGDFPSQDGYWNGMGNPAASYYPFTVFIDGSADLQEGTYVNVTYSTATSEQGIYLENPFLRTEQGKSYVYVAGANGKLEKRFVTTGKSLWGSYTEILSGLTAEDLIAFPYGKTVTEGADTVESDLSTLYG